MTTETVEVPIEQQTEHPHIVQVAGICGGRPTIKGARISVRHIAQLCKAGDTVEEILQAHPHLRAAAVYDAISYYLDHQIEIEQEIADNRIEAVMKKYGAEMDDRGVLHFTEKASAQ
jgi:uncharacterized protein (DUF433 family)